MSPGGPLAGFQVPCQGAPQPRGGQITDLCDQAGQHRDSWQKYLAFDQDLFVPASRRWGDPFAKLLQGPAWEKARSRICRTLGRSPTSASELEGLGQQLDGAYRRAANNLPTNSAVTIEQVGRRHVLTLTPLDKLDEPVSLVDLRRDATTRLPRVDLTEVLPEVLA